MLPCGTRFLGSNPMCSGKQNPDSVGEMANTPAGFRTGEILSIIVPLYRHQQTESECFRGIRGSELNVAMLLLTDRIRFVVFFLVGEHRLFALLSRHKSQVARADIPKRLLD